MIHRTMELNSNFTKNGHRSRAREKLPILRPLTGQIRSLLDGTCRRKAAGTNPIRVLLRRNLGTRIQSRCDRLRERICSGGHGKRVVMFHLLVILLGIWANVSSTETSGIAASPADRSTDIALVDSGPRTSDLQTPQPKSYESDRWTLPRKPASPARRSIANSTSPEEVTSDRLRVPHPIAEAVAPRSSATEFSAMLPSRVLPCSLPFSERTPPLLI